MCVCVCVVCLCSLKRVEIFNSTGTLFALF